jgi:hypothetical protein
VRVPLLFEGTPRAVPDTDVDLVVSLDDKEKFDDNNSYL